MVQDSSSKTILIVTQPDVVNTVGGAITVFVQFCNMLSDNGYNVCGTCYNKISGQPSNLKPNVIFTNLYYEYSGLNYSQAMNNKIEDCKPDLIIFFFHYLYIDANLSQNFKHIPRILMFHSRPDFYFAIHPNAAKELEPLYINTTAQVLFDSYKNLLPDYIKQNGIISIPNASPYQTMIIDTNIEHKRIIYLSRIDNCKGLEFLIHSFKIIANKYKDWQIHIYGQSQPPEYINALINLTKKLNIDKQILFKGITNDPSKIFLKYDFCVFPSYFEGFPMGLIEAQSLGLPCIGLKECSGVNELIIDGYNGFLCNETYEDFALKIKKLIQNQGLREKFSRNAVTEAKKYNSDIVKQKWLETIANIINQDIYSDEPNNISKNIRLFPIDKIIKMASHNEKTKWYQHIFSIKNISKSNKEKKKRIYIFGFKFTITRSAISE